MRTLASIRKINDIYSIKNADKIEVAKVEGWEVVTKKGEYQVGDLCIYIEIDSRVPTSEPFEFMRDRDFKVKTIKLRGQISQGLIMPLSLLPSTVNIIEGMDVTKVLGISRISRQNQPNNSNIKRVKSVKNYFSFSYMRKKCLDIFGKHFGIVILGDWYTDIKKTDEDRVQYMLPILEKYKGQNAILTEKLDGSSMTFYVKHNSIRVFSRNKEILGWNTPNTWCTFIAKLFKIQPTNLTNQYAIMSFKLKSQLYKLHTIVGADFVIQGELIGPSIQGNKYDRQGYEFYAFNAYVKYPTVQILERLKQVGIRTVPIHSTITLNHSIKDLVEISRGFSVLNKKQIREGLVLRIEGHYPPVSCKIINPDFSLKYQDDEDTEENIN